MGISKLVMSGLALGAMALTSGACGGDSNTAPDASINVTTGTYYHYVTTAIKLGDTTTEADSYAFDLDNDPHHRPDNRLGETLVSLKNQVNIQSSIDTALNEGQFIILHSMRSDSLTADSTVSWQVFLGDPKLNPFVDGGSNTFTVAASSPTDAKVLGGITASEFAGGPAKLTLQISLVAGAAPLVLHLISAHIQADCTATGCTGGKIGGAILVTDINDTIMPAIAQQLDQTVTAHGCPAGPACTANDKAILSLFDTCTAPTIDAGGCGAVCNHDGHVSTDEVKCNPLVSAVLSPDMDLLDAAGNPGTDGVKESVSIGLGFTASSTTFVAPGE